MMDLTKLIDLLPYYFKENDTYKDDQGKGILERFLEICGNYFEDQVVANTEELLDNLSVKDCPEHFLSYFWEWFGCIPFAEGEFIDPDKWAHYYNGFDSQDVYDSKKKYWTFEDDRNPLPLTIDQKRRILRYAISLLKCRGSRIFYEAMFQLYGVELIGIYDHAVEDVKNLNGDTILEALPSTVDSEVPQMDDELLLMDNDSYMDEQIKCMQCIPAYFYIRYTGSYLSEFTKAIVNFITKYIPFNCRPIIHIVDADGNDSTGEIYYIRVTNVKTGESRMDTSESGTEASPWVWEISSNFQLFFRVEVWSTYDPDGTNSTWFCLKSGEQFGDDTETYPNNTVRVIYETNTGDDSITYAFYNREYQDHQVEGIQVYVPLNIRTVIVDTEGYSLDVQVYQDGSLLETNPTEPFVVRGKEVRVYALYYPNMYITQSENNTLTSIVVSPSVSYEIQGSVNQYDERYYVLNNLQPGTYTISVANMPSLYRIITIAKENIEYRVRCVDDSFNDITSDVEIPVESGSTVSFYVIIEPTDTSITDYSEVIGTYIQCINNGTSYIVSRLDDTHYGIQFTTRFAANYKFRSLSNEDLTDESLWDNANVVKLKSSSINFTMTPSTYELDLYNTESDSSARTIRFTIEVYSSNSSFTFSNTSSQNGTVELEVFETLNATTEASYKEDWWGNTSFEIIRIDDTRAYFNLTVPYITSSSGDPYIGVLQLTYVSPSGETTDPSTVIVTYTKSTTVVTTPYVTVIPYDENDTNWQIDWSQQYPHTYTSGSEQVYYPMVQEVTYQKTQESDTCRFTLELNGYEDTQTYTHYSTDSTTGIETAVDTVEVEDVTQTITFQDPGRYEFIINEDVTGGTVNITVKDFVPSFKVTCNPDSAFLESQYSSVTTRVSLNISPTKSTYSYQVRVLKDGVDTGVILDCTSAQEYTANATGTYTFRSIDAESELTGSDLEDSVGTFEVYDSSSIVSRIVCDPSTATINQSNTSASTVVRLYDINGNEVVDSNFTIIFPDGSTYVSGTTFTTTEVGTYTFTSSNNPYVSATFTVTDTTIEAYFGGVYIEDRNTHVHSWPSEESERRIDFTAWDTVAGGSDMFSVGYNNLTTDDLVVTYGPYVLNGGNDDEYVTIPAGSPTGIRYSLFQPNGSGVDNVYYIIIYNLTLDEDTEIRIRPASDPTYSTGYDYYHIFLKTIITSIALTAPEGDTYPGVSSVITGLVQMSDYDTHYMGYDQWHSIYSEDNTTVYLDGEALTRVDSNPSEGEWAPAEPSNTSYIGIQVYFTQSVHTLYMTIRQEDDEYPLITSNTLRIACEAIPEEPDLTDQSYLLYSEEDGSDSWQTPSTSYSVSRPIDSDDSSPFWVTGGLSEDGSNIQTTDEPYEYLGNTGSATLRDLGTSSNVSVGQQFTGVQNFQISDGAHETPTFNFQLVNYPSRNFALTLDPYEASATYNVERIIVRTVYRNSVENDNLRLQVDYNLHLGYRNTEDGDLISMGVINGHIDELEVSQSQTFDLDQTYELGSLNVYLWPWNLASDEGGFNQINFNYLMGSCDITNVTFQLQSGSTILYQDTVFSLTTTNFFMINVEDGSNQLNVSYDADDQALTVNLTISFSV